MINISNKSCIETLTTGWMIPSGTISYPHFPFLLLSLRRYLC